MVDGWLLTRGCRAAPDRTSRAVLSPDSPPRGGTQLDGVSGFSVLYLLCGSDTMIISSHSRGLPAADLTEDTICGAG
jgi:hypothetical protein